MGGNGRKDKPYAGAIPTPGRDGPELDPFEIEFRPEFRQGRGPREPFVNEHEVVIGDHDYESENSPLQRWSEETDPSVMAGEQWVHPYKDVGFLTSENRELFERGVTSSRPFAHPTHSSASSIDPDDDTGYPVPEVLDEP